MKRHDRNGQPPHRRRNSISEQFVAHMGSMLRSPAYQVLSRAARQVETRLEIEHMNHGGAENGNLKCTYADFVGYGVHPNSVAPALRELEALGLIQVMRRGGIDINGGRHPSVYRLTYLRAKDASGDGTHEWRKVRSIEQAKTLANAARQDTDPFKVIKAKQTRPRKLPSKSVLKSPSISVANPEFSTTETEVPGSIRFPSDLSISREDDSLTQ